MMNYIMKQAKKANARLQADFISNDRNRMMYITYKFGGFTEVSRQGELIVLENDLTQIQDIPPYVTVHIEE